MLSRRSIIGAAAGAAAGVHTAAQAAMLRRPVVTKTTWYSVRMFRDESFEAFMSSLANVNQVDGTPYYLCEATGSPYVEVFQGALARLGDEKVVEGFVMRHVARDFSSLFDGRRDATIHWRVRPEMEVIDHYEWVGNEMVPDPSWKVVKFYARLVVV